MRWPRSRFQAAFPLKRLVNGSFASEIVRDRPIKPRSFCKTSWSKLGSGYARGTGTSGLMWNLSGEALGSP
jgi:hypothetical protein